MGAKPFDTLRNACRQVAAWGYKAIQVPTWDGRCIDLKQAAESKAYCDDWQAVLQEFGLDASEGAFHLQGQLVAVNPVYDEVFDGFAPEAVRGNPKARTAWAIEQCKLVAQASRNLGLTVAPGFTGSLAFPFLYPWPPRPKGLIDAAFTELGSRWKPILDVFEECGVDVAWELHPGEDVFDGLTYERFQAAVGNHKRSKINYDPSHFLLQCLDYLEFIRIYHDQIVAFHVKDAEYRPSGRCGVYGGYADWVNRAGRFRSLGDGQVDFKSIFALLTQYGYAGWATLEWECCIKGAEQGAQEGAPFIASCIITPPERAFDDFADAGVDANKINRLLGLAA
ncbi:MAG: sugar phosphate isomerase/epimerase [Patescibacteria group bacterium]|nr:sugar phosphate isomerase/epimerase [Patescibacteria group bacterium]